MIVVFDTNIWLNHLYLRAPAGAATRYFIAQKNARVALPEVIRLEVEHHLRTDLRTNVNKIRKSYERLLALFGTLKEVVLPDDEQIEKKVSEAFSLGVDLIDIPFTLESARSSFLKTIDKKPPSDKGQQFKDGVLWADCLTLAKGEDVTLVTGDLAFFEGRDKANGLASSLRDELSSSGGNVTLHYELSQLLEEIRSEVHIDEDQLAEAFREETRAATDDLVQRAGFQIAERTGLNSELFVTENTNVLFLKFIINLRCVDVTGAGRDDAALELSGDGFYNSDTGEFSELEELGTELRFRDLGGEEEVRRNVVVRVGGFTLGHADVAHVVRHKIQ